MNPHDGETDPASAATTVAPTDHATADRSAAVNGADEVAEPLDLARIERDLDGVEAALRRLDDGSYWTDEVTGATLPDELLEADPVARRAES